MIETKQNDSVIQKYDSKPFSKKSMNQKIQKYDIPFEKTIMIQHIKRYHGIIF